MHQTHLYRVLTLLVLGVCIPLTGCGYMVRAAMGENAGIVGRNALEISYQRAPSAALADIKEYIRGRGASVEHLSQWEVRSSTIRSNNMFAGKMSNAQQQMMNGMGGFDMRIIAKIESSNNQSSDLIVGANVYNRTNDSWERAETGSILNFSSGAYGDKRTPAEVAFDSLQRSLIARYGSEAVNYVNATF